MAVDGKGRRECSVPMKVPFHDVDAMHVVWHGHYLKYFEIARDALMADLGIDLQQYAIDAGWVFPIVKSQVKHVSPLRYQDAFTCKARLVEGKRRIVIEFEIHRESDRALCARGRTEQLAVRIRDLELQMEIPGDIQKALGFLE